MGLFYTKATACTFRSWGVGVRWRGEGGGGLAVSWILTATLSIKLLSFEVSSSAVVTSSSERMLQLGLCQTRLSPRKLSTIIFLNDQGFLRRSHTSWFTHYFSLLTGSYYIRCYSVFMIYWIMSSWQFLNGNPTHLNRRLTAFMPDAIWTVLRFALTVYRCGVFRSFEAVFYGVDFRF